jgi:hypothetical protein
MITHDPGHGAAIRETLRRSILARWLPHEDPAGLLDTTPLVTGGILDSARDLAELAEWIEATFAVQLGGPGTDDFDSIGKIAAMIERARSAKPADRTPLDRLDWRPIPPPGTSAHHGDDLPVATHEGTLDVAGVAFRVHRLADGRRIIDEADFERLFAGLGPGETEPAP